jgi:hypothetical protein
MRLHVTRQMLALQDLVSPTYPGLILREEEGKKWVYGICGATGASALVRLPAAWDGEAPAAPIYVRGHLPHDGLYCDCPGVEADSSPTDEPWWASIALMPKAQVPPFERVAVPVVGRTVGVDAMLLGRIGAILDGRSRCSQVRLTFPEDLSAWKVAPMGDVDGEAWIMPLYVQP